MNARIVLDEYQVVRHFSDSIAPVGILRPLKFHLEKKVDIQSLISPENISETSVQKLETVFEVEDTLERCEDTFKPLDCSADPIDDLAHKFNISRTNNKRTLSLSCSLQDSCNDLREDLMTVLAKIESLLAGFGFGWENVVYVAGTFGYLSPECFQRLTVTDKCDVYSFGMVLLVMVCMKEKDLFLNKANMFGNQHLEGKSEIKYLEKFIDDQVQPWNVVAFI
ncbi:uncharacterized protein LOC130982728 [Arachis stenosperma]|uniref:uncharacterized protein LOC130982728 n=1 Tax=Arachis stenosperma TaxID=217475 RepID=UPI0025AD4FA8|nr:uncharacterized protein LOC130982728 [Arachis stenosperma]XP_057762784.1 uncharacterized protein LOC130982728 [Arachis stenosperma]XP_057762785.1 uncharacterized protein LOC130982728 [Arachis stenosperma]